MTVLLPEREPRQGAAAPDSARTLDTLATVLVVIITIAVLYFAREILVPVAIAILMSFVLSPLVKALRNLGVNKKLAVGLVVLTTFLGAVGLGAVLAKQISDLAHQAPRYRTTVIDKADSLRAFATSNPLMQRMNGFIAAVTHIAPQQPALPQPKASGAEPDKRGFETRKPGAKPPSPLEPGKPGAPIPVEVITPAPGVLTILQEVVGVAASPLATAAFVAIFIVFILMQREDLRNRFIRLVGAGDLQRTTLAMRDATDRLSRYLLAQVLLNTSFGVVVGCFLALVGVPAAVMWGIIAAVMRFIPYLGTVGAAAGPILMAAVVGEGWSMVVETAVFFVVLEAIVGQVVEPLLYGDRTGISPIAVVASATFWTWLWGPIGLVLATPLTVCLIVIGRHVERLAFLDVLLGDAPALSPAESFYQRMLAGDPSEAIDFAESYLAEHSLLDYCDEVALPTLLMAQADVRRGTLDEGRQLRIRDTMRELVDELSDEHAFFAPEDDEASDPPAALAPENEGEPATRPSLEEQLPKVEVDPAWGAEGTVLCIAGRTPLDEAAAGLLADLLVRRGIGAAVASGESLKQPEGAAPPPAARLVILSFLDADLRLAQARFAVRRLRRRVPGVPILSAFWMAQADETRASRLCSDVRCDVCVSSLPQALALCLERAALRPAPTPKDASRPGAQQPRQETAPAKPEPAEALER